MTEQVRAMSSRFPGFKVTFDGGCVVIWKGQVQPLGKTYRLRVMLVLKDFIGEMPVVVPSPRVWLDEPVLKMESEYAPGVTVPHIYRDFVKPQNSHLCLFDPLQSEWNRTMAVADTTIPWAIDWLVSYEGWLATGAWSGGGRDHSAPPPK